MSDISKSMRTSSSGRTLCVLLLSGIDNSTIIVPLRNRRCSLHVSADHMRIQAGTNSGWMLSRYPAPLCLDGSLLRPQGLTLKQVVTSLRYLSYCFCWYTCLSCSTQLTQNRIMYALRTSRTSKLFMYPPQVMHITPVTVSSYTSAPSACLSRLLNLHFPTAAK